MQGCNGYTFKGTQKCTGKTLQSTKKMQGCQNVERLTKRLLSCRFFRVHSWTRGAQLRAQGVQMKNTRAPLYTYKGTYGTQYRVPLAHPLQEKNYNVPGKTLQLRSRFGRRSTLWHPHCRVFVWSVLRFFTVHLCGTCTLASLPLAPLHAYLLYHRKCTP